MLICGTYPIRNAITVDFGVSTANATSAEAVTASPYPKRDHKHSDTPANVVPFSPQKLYFPRNPFIVSFFLIREFFS